MLCQPFESEVSISAANRLHLGYRSSWQHVLHDIAGCDANAALVFERLNVAFGEAAVKNDVAAQMALSAHAMAFMVADWSRLNGWQAWVERFDAASESLVDASCDVESSLARATGAMARALLLGESLKTMAPLGEKLQAMIKTAATAHQATHMALAGAVLLPLFQMTRAVSDAQVLHAQMTETWSHWHAANDATGLLSLLWFVSWAQHWHFAHPARLPECLAQLDIAIGGASKEMLKRGVSFRYARLNTDNALHRKSDELVQAGLHAMLTAMHPDRPMERVIYNAQAAIFAGSRNDPDGALRHIEHMNRALQLADCPPSISAIYRAREGAIYLGMERYGAAVQAFETATSSVPDSQSAVPIGYVALTHALEALQQGDFQSSLSVQCGSDLRCGLAAVRATSTHGFFFSAPKARAAVCAIALRENIEVEFVREALKLVPTPPPSWVDEHWPWMMSLRCLGGFRVLATFAEGQRADKASSRPLMLLKLIAAHGAQGVPVATALDVLWPGQDGDQAEHTLTMTLQRLRRMFVDNDLIHRNDGWLRFNSEKVWTDVAAFEAHVEPMPEEGAAATEAESARYVKRLFDLYRGDCLLGIDDGWAVDRAGHYRSRMNFTVHRVVQQALLAGHHHAAELALTRAIERGLDVANVFKTVTADPSAEPMMVALKARIASIKPAQASTAFH